jgi:hypothetical protein
MSELREVFDMVTKQTEPDVDAWKEQERRQRRTSRNRRLSALALVAAIGIVAVVVVIRAADEGTGTQPGGQGTDTTELPTEESIPLLPSGSVEPGRYVVASREPVLAASYRISIEVPDGYDGFENFFVLKRGFSTEAAVGTMAISEIYADACQWRGTALGRSAVSSGDEAAAALASQQGLRVSTPTDVVVDGYAGTYMERRVPARTDVSDCDGGEGGEFRVYLSPGFGSRLLRPGQLQQLWILDLGGVPFVIEALLDAGTSAQVRTELLQIVESIQIDPR